MQFVDLWKYYSGIETNVQNYEIILTYIRYFLSGYSMWNNDITLHQCISCESTLKLGKSRNSLNLIFITIRSVVYCVMMHENKRVEIVLQILRRRILKIDNLIRSYSCVCGRNLFHHSISTANRYISTSITFILNLYSRSCNRYYIEYFTKFIGKNIFRTKVL